MYSAALKYSENQFSDVRSTRDTSSAARCYHHHHHRHFFKDEALVHTVCFTELFHAVMSSHLRPAYTLLFRIITSTVDGAQSVAHYHKKT